MIIRCEDLCKAYDKIKALDNLNIEVPEGIIYGLLGPNGAGKSTFINILSSIVKHDSGEIYVFDRKIPDEFSKIKKNMGFVP